MSIARIMNMGVGSMQNSQTALKTSGHNIANANTEGFSKQSIHTLTEKPIAHGNLYIGDGARVSNIKRNHDEFLTKQINKEQEIYGKLDEKAKIMESVEAVFNEADGDGFSNTMTRMFNDIRKLSVHPESTAVRATTMESFKAFTASVNKLGANLEKVQKNIDADVESTVKEINATLKEITNLNINISKLELSGQEANDLRDRRELLIKKLSNTISVESAEDGRTGMVSLTLAGTASVLNGNRFNELSINRVSQDSGEGIARVVMRSNDTVAYDLTDSIKKGRLASMVEVRDHYVPDLRSKMEHIVYNLANKMNDIHTKGFDLDNKIGNKIFAGTGSEKGVLNNIKVSSDILDEPRKLAIASQAYQPSNNDVAIQLTELQRERFIYGKDPEIDNALNSGDPEKIKWAMQENSKRVGSNPSDLYNAIVSGVGIETREFKETSKHQSHVLSQLNDYKDSLSGVSLDEEAVDLIKYQKAFEASARMIRVADEMLETVINLKRY